MNRALWTKFQGPYAGSAWSLKYWKYWRRIGLSLLPTGRYWVAYPRMERTRRRAEMKASTSSRVL